MNCPLPAPSEWPSKSLQFFPSKEKTALGSAAALEKKAKEMARMLCRVIMGDGLDPPPDPWWSRSLPEEPLDWGSAEEVRIETQTTQDPPPAGHGQATSSGWKGESTTFQVVTQPRGLLCGAAGNPSAVLTPNKARTQGTTPQFLLPLPSGEESYH